MTTIFHCSWRDKVVTKVFVAGHNGMVGSAICRQLRNQDVEVMTASRQELDLTNQAQVKKFFTLNKFDQVYLAAAKVGGIHANKTYPVDFIYENLMIQSNVIHQSYEAGVKKLMFLGSSCIYPKHAMQPIHESELLNGYLEPTNEPYAIAKISGIKMCESYSRQLGVDYRSVMPTNLYGPGDNYHSKNSHVIPGMLRRFHEAKKSGCNKVIVWGSGRPKREFMYVEDMARACVSLMAINRSTYKAKLPEEISHVNIGTGVDHTIFELAQMIREVVEFNGKLEFDTTKPDGAPQKLLNISLLNSLGFESHVNLADGLALTYKHFIEELTSSKARM